jgi:hypothetical protein
VYHLPQQPGQKSHDAILWFGQGRVLKLSGGDGMPDRASEVKRDRLFSLGERLAQADDQIFGECFGKDHIRCPP